MLFKTMANAFKDWKSNQDSFWHDLCNIKNPQQIFIYLAASSYIKKLYFLACRVFAKMAKTSKIGPDLGKNLQNSHACIP